MCASWFSPGLNGQGPLEYRLPLCFVVLTPGLNELRPLGREEGLCARLSHPRLREQPGRGLCQGEDLR